ncbi:MAG: DUF5005 domain-containing protein [Bacteroidetes bacterium]|nr:DUF5005 domain-containing protein [Bacteroidota bacterium]
MSAKTLTINTLSFLLVIITSGAKVEAQSYKDTVFTSYFQQNGPDWLASDGTLSIPLPDGRNMWLMGDSHIGQNIDSLGKIPCLFNVRSCILIQDSLNLSDLKTFYDTTGSNAYEKQFVKMPGDSLITYWPSSGTVRQDTVFTFWSRFQKDPASTNLLFIEMVIAKIKIPEIELVEVVPIQYPNVYYGLSVVWDEKDQYYYLYGKKVDFVVFRPLLARCTYNNLHGPWEFYAGNQNWSADPDSAVHIANEASAQYTVFFLNDQYHLFFQKNGFLQCGLGREMFIYSAAEPWGPFNNPTLVYTMEDQFDGIYPKTYNGQAHPQFIENDELLISYNINKICPNPCSGNPFTARYNPDMYRPQFARVPLCIFAKDVENPLIICAKDTTVMADSTGNFTVINDEFDPVSVWDNCQVLNVSNNFNGSPSLTGSTFSPGTTSITWIVTDSAGNSQMCDFEITVEKSSMAEDLLMQSGILIYPNPIRKTLFIDDNRNLLQEISLYDIEGQRLVDIKKQSGHINIDMSQFGSGVYVLKLQVENRIVSKKISHYQ